MGPPGELCEQWCAEMIQSPHTSAAQVPWGEQSWQWGVGGVRACTHSLQSRGCIPRYHQGQQTWDLPTAVPGGRSWWSWEPIPVSPFTSSQTLRGTDITGPGFSSELSTLDMTVSVQIRLGLASTFHHCQLYPVSSMRGDYIYRCVL